MKTLERFWCDYTSGVGKKLMKASVANLALQPMHSEYVDQFLGEWLKISQVNLRALIDRHRFPNLFYIIEVVHLSLVFVGLFAYTINTVSQLPNELFSLRSKNETYIRHPE